MKCKTKGCANSPRLHKRYCHKCRSRKYRNNNPILFFYQNLRTHAKARGKEFTLTFNHFKNIISVFPDFIEGYGRGKGKYTIDRIKNEQGYIDGNIQILLHEENSRKHIFTQEEYGSLIPCNDPLPF